MKARERVLSGKGEQRDDAKVDPIKSKSFNWLIFTVTRENVGNVHCNEMH